MSVKIRGEYLGNKKLELVHEFSKTRILTDAPLDNHGEATSFSPTDLIAAGLASCVITIMGIMAESNGFEIDGTKFEVEKEMTHGPRRISKITVQIHLPNNLTEEQRRAVESCANTCPVKHSLLPAIECVYEYFYDVRVD